MVTQPPIDICGHHYPLEIDYRDGLLLQLVVLGAVRACTAYGYVRVGY